MLSSRELGLVGLAAAGGLAYVSALVVLLLLATLPGPSLTVPYNGRSYYHTSVVVPGANTTANPLSISFHNTTFVLGWPPAPAGPSSGVFGVQVTIYETGGNVAHLATGCAACGDFPEASFTPDGRAGIAWTAEPAALGVVTLLVASPPAP